MAEEIGWGWAEISCILVQRFAPNGGWLWRRDLAAIPPDMVLREEREPEFLELKWITVAEALRLRSLLSAARKPAGVSELQGRWQKFACVFAWKYAKDGARLTEMDRSAVPPDKVLLQHGHRDSLEFRFVSRDYATRMALWERENEGKLIAERVQ